MRSKLFLLTAWILSFGFYGCDVVQVLLQNTQIPLTNEEVVEGLKTALRVGSDTSVSVLAKTDGYFKDQMVKILLPAEAQPVLETVEKIPGGKQLVQNAVMAINKAAEDAAPEAKAIFRSAITGITIADGFSILRGGETAATNYLKDKTFQPLSNAFKPKIKNSLSKPLVLNTSAEASYSKLINAYNTASLGGVLWPKIKTNSLTDHVTQKALDGLFVKVAAEEQKIRRDPAHQVTEILKRVFGSN